ncbi:hypothetical protein DSO57_1004703 [Entomophthora muscae]|uniref:Uncharacterized protein n=1 Tax=Entomophthora muscae TaxID=34485 RepID=A0ACC2SX18_9FUNG|nr:hypothetical protein DSO57_1004703 [Entomophthora muscae]
MILPVIKFVVFSLALLLLLLWLTSPDLWSKITSSSWLVGNNPSSLLDLSSGLLFSGEAVVKSLTCGDLDLDDVDFTQSTPAGKDVSMASIPSLEKSNLVPLQVPEAPPSRYHLYPLAARRSDTDGFECMLPSTVPCVLSVVPSSSGCPSPPLGGILVVCLTGMRAKLSYFSPSLSHNPCIASLTDQVATMCGKIKYLQQRFSDPDDSSSESSGGEETEILDTPSIQTMGAALVWKVNLVSTVPLLWISWQR